MKLYERLMETDINTWPTLGGYAAAQVSLHEMMAAAVRYKIDNVATYFWQHEQEYWDLANSAHFPSLAPPHDLTWLEYKMPTRYRLEGGERVYRPELQNTHVGCLVSALDRDRAPEHFGQLEDDAFWILQCFIIIGRKHHTPYFGGDGFIIGVNYDGSCAHDLDGRPFFNVMINQQTGHAISDEHAAGLSQASKPFLLTFSFLAAKNVIVVDNDPRPKSRKSARKSKKKRAYTPCRTLEIRPLADALRVRNRKGGGSGRRLASVSITRGHFRTYTESGKLFGKHVGTFWIPSHVRGRSKGDEPGKDREIKL